LLGETLGDSESLRPSKKTIARIAIIAPTAPIAILFLFELGTETCCDSGDV